MDDADMIEIPAVLMRGGTSKALFFHEKDLPPAGPDRDRMLLRAMGSPDLMQIDGLGGSRLVTSKIAIIRPSDRPDADVIYTFAQVDTDRAVNTRTGDEIGVSPFVLSMLCMLIFAMTMAESSGQAMAKAPKFRPGANPD